jgi:hypothetical protein
LSCSKDCIFSIFFRVQQGTLNHPHNRFHFISFSFSNPSAYSPPMENHLLSGNNGTLEYKTSLPPISPGRYSPIPKHMLVEDDYTRLDMPDC